MSMENGNPGVTGVKLALRAAIVKTVMSDKRNDPVVVALNLAMAVKFAGELTGAK